MSPANTVHTKLIEFLLSIFKESAVVFTVILVWLFSALPIVWDSRLLRGQEPDHRLKEKQNVVVAVDFEFFKIRTTQQSLECVLLHEFTNWVNPFQVLNDLNLLTFIYPLVVLK
jgi:hypothetical protein